MVIDLLCVFLPHTTAVVQSYLLPYFFVIISFIHEYLEKCRDIEIDIQIAEADSAHKTPRCLAQPWTEDALHG